ncbi:TPA: LPXTG cell wall anchor domain-containing protein, partial [Streptococcus suis]|nr:LPXTG cell wall anchor domain-containing protein [Streptococcus suis]
STATTETSTSSSTTSTEAQPTKVDSNDSGSSNPVGITEHETPWVHYRSYYDLLNKKEILPATKDSGKWAGIPEISGYIYVSVFGDGSAGQASFVYYYVPEGTDLTTVKKLLNENNLNQQAVSNLDTLFPTKQEQASKEGQGISSTEQEQPSEEGQRTSSTKPKTEKAKTTTNIQKTLPTTGEVASLLSLVGLVGLSALVLAKPFRKK